MIDEAERQSYSRRNLLRYTAGGTAVVLAGCSANPPGQTTDTSSDGTQSDGTAPGGQGLVDPRYDFLLGASDTADNLTWNPYHQLRVKNIGESLTMYNQAQSEWVPVLAKDWKYKQNGTFTITLADATWWNGDPVTAQDAITKWTIDEVIYGESSAVNGTTKVNEKTIEFDVSSGINSNLLEETLLRWKIDLRTDLWKEEFQRAKDVSGDQAVKQLKQDIVTRKIDKPYGNWIFKAVPGSATKQSISYEKHDGHPHADTQNIPKARWFVPTGATQVEQMMTSGKGDGTNQASSQKVVEKYKQNGISELNVGLPIGTGIAMNQQRKEFQDRRVRQAIAYITNPKQVEKAGVGSAAKGHVYPPTGIAGSIDPSQYIPEDLLSKFPTYEQDRKKATSLLKEAGFSGGSSGWTTPSGKPFEPEILTGGPWQEGSQIVMANLKQFGINASLRPVENYFEKRNTPDWDLSLNPWGSWQYRFHPVGAYQVDLLATIFSPQPVNQWKTFCTPREAMEDGTITVPWPPGNPDGSEKAVNLEKKIKTIQTTNDEQKAKTLCQECSWIYNQTMPIRPLTVNIGSYFVNTDRFEAPGNDEWQTNAAFTNLLSLGIIKARKK